MKNLPFWLFLIFGLMTSIQSKAQEKVPYSYSYKSDGSNPGTLKKLTNVNYNGTRSLRIYFDNVKLAGSSYILLKNYEGHSQKLDSLAMTEWDNTSAYFNGNTLEIYLMEMEGQKSSFEISSVRISSPSKMGDNGNSARTNPNVVTQPNNSQHSEHELEGPYKLAAGRFTNGNDVFGTGWIAPNGAIVTSFNVYSNYIYGQLYDVIEFNIPPANEDGTINHPGPEDQYPVKGEIEHVSIFVESIAIESFNNKNILHHSQPGFAILKPLPNSLGQLPGERQQSFFRIYRNPPINEIKSRTNKGLDVSDIKVSIVHHGINFHPPTDNRTTQMTISKLRNPEKYIEGSYFEDNILKTKDRQKFVVYDISTIPAQNLSGGPVLLHNFYAIGVHGENFGDGTSVGWGFRHEYFRNSLETFMTGPDTFYMDKYGFAKTQPNGKIDLQFNTLESAAEKIPPNSILNISIGYYSDAVIVDKPMKLIAPVGVVVLGAAEDPNARMAFGQHFEDDFEVQMDIEEAPKELLSKEPKVYPNPFSDNINIDFSTSEIARVNIQVYDMRGNIIGTLVEGQEFAAGSHTVVWDGLTASRSSAPKGLYVVLVQVNHRLSTFKVIKN